MTETVAIACWILLAGSLGACAVLMTLVERLYRRVEALEVRAFPSVQREVEHG